MATVGRLYKDSFNIAGTLNERLPAVTDGLVAHFPFDGTFTGINPNPIMDYSIWKAGQTGSISPFGQYGSNNRRVMGTDPWGKETVVWESYSVEGSTAAGGIYFDPKPVDNTKLYRMSFWEKRVTNNGITPPRYYFGLNAYGSVNGVCNLSDGAHNTNPYFWSGASLPNNEWYLIVGHVFPHNHSSAASHQDSGQYKVTGEKFAGISQDFKWAPETTTGRSRTLSVYSPAGGGVIHHTAYPRIDVCDGSEPSLQDLLSGEANVINPFKVRYIREYMNGSSANTSNHWTELEAYTLSGINVARAKGGTSSTSTWNALLTDGIKTTNPYWGLSAGEQWVQVDLGSLYNIDRIKVWHYFGDSRTYKHVKLQVSPNGVTWYTIFNSDIDGEYTETSEGKTHVIDTRQIQELMTIQNGFAVEESTANIARVDGSMMSCEGEHIGNVEVSNSTRTAMGGNWQAATSYNDGICRIEYAMTPNGWGKFFRWIHRSVVGWKGIVAYGYGVSLTAGTTYAFSIWVRVNTGTYGNPDAYAFYGPDAANRVHFAWEKSPASNPNEWIRGKAIFTPATNVTGEVYLYGISAGLNGLTVDYYGYQIEENKSFVTSFTSNPRNNKHMDIPMSLTGPISIALDFTPTQPNNYTTHVNGVLSVDAEINNERFLIWNRSTEDYYRVRVNSVDLTLSNTDIVQGNRASIVASSNGTATSIYLNGSLKGTIAQPIVLTSKITLGRYGDTDTAQGNNIIHSLSVYNKALSEEEVKRLYDHRSLPLGSAGDLSTEITERPAMPSDVYYFPLNTDTDDEHRAVTPSSSSNISYLGGAAWVGRATTNVAAKTLASYAPYNTLVQKGQNLIFTMTPGGAHYLTVNNGTDYNGSIVTLSGYMYKNGLPHALPGNRANTYHTVPATTWDFNPTTGYFQIVENCNASSVWLFHTASGAVAGDVIEIRDFQVEVAPYASPFIAGTRPLSELEYNLNGSIGLDWSGNWTIVYWKKPVGTSSGNYTGYSIDSLGCNSNSVGGGYIWWGKGSGTDSINSSTPSAFTPSDFFGKWHMISLRKSGTTLTVTEWDVGGQNHIRNATVSTSAANYYVTQYGYDLKLSGWDNANASDAYFRDLIVAKRALSDDEIKSIRATGISVRGNGQLLVRNRLIEGNITDDTAAGGLKSNTTVGGSPIATKKDIPVMFRVNAGKLEYLDLDDTWEEP